MAHTKAAPSPRRLPRSPSSVRQPAYKLAASIMLLAVVCGFAISSGRAVSRTKYKYIRYYRSMISAPDPTLFCQSVVNVNKEFTEEDIACERLGELEDVYSVGDKVIGSGFKAEGRILTHKQTGVTYVGRFVKQAFSSQATDTVKTINLARRACGHPHIMQIADMKCYQGNFTLVWTRCRGKKLMTVLKPSKFISTTSQCALPEVSLLDIQTIVKQLVDIVNYLTDRLLIHGDVFIQNMFYDYNKREICLIDFDASRTLRTNFYLPNQRNNTEQQQEIGNAADRNRVYQDDMLGVGGVLAALIGIPKFETSKTDISNTWQTNNFVRMLGAHDYRHYRRQYELSERIISRTVLQTLPLKRTNWSEYITDCNRHLATDDAVDFFDKVMRYSFMERYEFFHRHAVAHPFLTQLLPSS